MAGSTETAGDPNSRTALDGDIHWIGDLKRVRRPGPFLGEIVAGVPGDSTCAVHAGSRDDPRTGAVGTPIYQNSTFLLTPEHYHSIEEGHSRDRFIYSRYGNPTQWAVQEKLATLERAESAIVFSSGMAAITSTVLTLMDKGAHVVASQELYGGTYNLFNQELPSLGMSAAFVDPRSPEAIEAAIRPNTQILYFEAITNPLLKVIDIPMLAAIAERHQLRLVIDATFATPIACRPLEHGADIVVHSASKYLNGHSDLIAGVAAGSRKLIDQMWPRMLTYGACLDPHACFLLERGLKTLAIRMKAHQRSALALARHLEAHPRIQHVFYPLLESHSDYAVANRLLENGTGNVTFVIEGGDEAALNLLDALTIPKQATSLGGVESLISLPFNTSQAGFTQRQRAAMGIDPGCVRLSVGIEDPADLIADFDQALTRIFC